VEASPRPIGETYEATTVETAEGPVAFAGHASLDELDLRERLIIAASVPPDVVVRTGLGSLAIAGGLGWALSPTARRERERLEFYLELGKSRDAATVFPRPTSGVTIETSRPGPWSFRAPGGRVSLLSFQSPFKTVNPALHDRYSHHTRNLKAWAQHWRHDDGPRPTLCVIHGFGASTYLVNSAFFALPWLYGKGYDVLLYLVPFHGPRRDLLSPFNGVGMFAGGPSWFNEAIFHSVHDFRIFLDYLQADGVTQVGVTGLSLGGYHAALLAAIEDRLELSIPNAAVTSIPDLLPDYFPLNLGLQFVSKVHGVPRDLIYEALELHSPLRYAPVLPRERLMIIGGLGDRLAPPEQSRLLWEHWRRPRLHWYPGNHLLHVNRAAYLREMRKFMKDVGFSP
jgi:pimeloyl-ACP methyl ester carboxylesterase